MLPREWVGQVHQGLGVEEAKPKTAVDHQPGSVPLPPGVAGQRVKLGGPNHNVLQVSPCKIWAEGANTARETGQWMSAELPDLAGTGSSILLLQGQGKDSSSQRSRG